MFMPISRSLKIVFKSSEVLLNTIRLNNKALANRQFLLRENKVTGFYI